MQRSLLVWLYTISFVLFPLDFYASDALPLQVSQVRDIVKNIDIATAIGQGGQDQISSLQDLENLLGGNISVLNIDMNNFTTQELQSVAFGGYAFIANPYNRSAGVSLNILKQLLSLDFKQMSKNGTNDIIIGLFGVDSSDNILVDLSQTSSTGSRVGVLDHFKLYIFKYDGTLLGTGPQYVPLNKYYSQQQQGFITPTFGADVITTSSSTNSTKTNHLNCFINGQNVTTSQLSYPYLVSIQNISGIDTPNRYLGSFELASLLPTMNTSPAITSYYQTLDSLEIALGSSVFSFNQNSFNQSTDVMKNGICADISQYIAPFANTGMQCMLVAVDSKGNIIPNITRTSVIDHYLLYLFEENSNLITAVYVDPQDSTDISNFKLNQSFNGVSVFINGQNITQGQSFVYPALIQLAYGTDVKIPSVASITNKIVLKKSETLSKLSYNAISSSGSAILDLSKKSLFGADWLASLSGLLDIGQTIIIHTQQTLYSAQGASGNELIFTAYALDSSTSKSSQIAQQSFSIPSALSGLQIEYQTSFSKSSQTLSFSNVQHSWLAIIPSGSSMPAQKGVSYAELQKITTYGALKAVLSMNNTTLYSNLVTSYAQEQNVIPGWYDLQSKQYSGQGFQFTLQQMEKAGKGYFFVGDNVDKSYKKFNGTTGVAGLEFKSLALLALEKTIVVGGSCTMVLLAFDKQGNYIPDIIKTAPDTFALFCYDKNGNLLSNFPLIFKASDYVGLGKYQLSSNSINPATFTVQGLGIHESKNLQYPFALKVTWKLSGSTPSKHNHKKKPKQMPIPTSNQIPSNMVISIPEYVKLTQFGCSLSSKKSQYFDATFMSTIQEKLINVGDLIKIKISTKNNTITATAYVQNKIVATSQPLTISTGQTFESVLYTISGGSQMTLPKDLISGYQDLWIECKVIQNVNILSYSLLSSLTLAQLQKYITNTNNASVDSLITNQQSLPGGIVCKSGFGVTLNQMKSGNGYAFVQDFWNSCSSAPFAGTSGIAGLGSSTPAYASLLAQMQAYSNVSLALLAFDAQNNYIADIIATAPTNFALFGYDTNGKLLPNFPVSFSANDYSGSGKYKIVKGATGPAIFGIVGLNISPHNINMDYPFVLNIKWKKSSSINQVVYPYKIGTLNPDELWLAVNINGVEHLLMNNKNSGLNIGAGWTKEYLKMPALQQIAQQTFDLGLTFSLVEIEGAVYVYVQINPGLGGGEGSFVAFAQLIGITTLPATVTWSGAFMESQPTIASNKAFLFTDAGSSWPTSVTVPGYPWN